MVYKKVSTSIYVLLLILSIFLIFNLYADRWPSGGRKYLSLENHLKEVLELPWADKLSVTEYELNIIKELDLDDPLFTFDVKPWFTDVPKERFGMFGYPGDTSEKLANRNRLESGLEILKKFYLEGSSDLGELRKAAQLFNAVNNEENRWMPAYHLGVSHLWSGQNIPAIEYFDQALARLKWFLDRPKNRSVEDRMRLYEGAAMTHYALGAARFQNVDSREEALGDFRKAVGFIKKIGNDPEIFRTAYASLGDWHSFFELQNTQTNTASIWSDLVAAYLSLPKRHDCVSQPSSVPDCIGKEMIKTDDCGYRDYMFCLGLVRAEPPYQASYQALYNGFYSGDYSREYLLWALSNIVDVNAFNSNLNHHHQFLYNSALLHIRIGHLEIASSQIDLAREGDMVDSVLNPMLRLDKEIQPGKRINRLQIVVRVLVGKSFSRWSCPDSPGPASRLREMYITMFGDQESPSFPPVGACFKNGHQEREVDKWLFVHRWRELLQKGEYAQFQKEFTSLMAQEPSGWFRKWREAIFYEIAKRAHERYVELSKQPEPEKARLIRKFVLTSRYFEVQSRNLFEPRFLEHFQRLGSRLISIFAALMVLLLFSFWHRRHRAILKVFDSFHRRRRLS